MIKNGVTRAAIRDLQTIFEAGTLGGLSDGQLLERFLAGREGAIFEAIIHRHGPMVWGVCRRVLRDHHDAEDAFQATFLVLARKATSVKPREKLGSWLYGVAYQTALKARATRAKRRVRETPMPDPPDPATAQDGRRDDLTSTLDRELSRLPEKYRIPIVLCELEGKTHKEAAIQLGWPIGTVSGRLSRARSMLARRLSRRGVTLTAGPLAVLLAQGSASASMPTQLIGRTAQAASLIAAGGMVTAGVVSAGVAALTGEVMKIMLMSKIKTAVAALLVAVLLVVGGIRLVDQAQAAGDRRQTEGVNSTIGHAARPEEPNVKDAASSPALALANDPPADPMASYPFKLDPDDVYELPDLAIDYRDFHLKAGPVSVVPIATERGITGAMVIGGGTFRYMPRPETTISGQFRALMLRFSPEEQAAILPLKGAKKVSDRGVTEMSRHLLRTVIRHCWQSNRDGGRIQEVLIPPRGTLAAVLYSREHGDLLISFDDRTATAYNFTDRKALYEKK